MDKLSNNDLQETANFLYQTRERLRRDYLHIQQYVNEDFKNSLDKQIDEVEKELESRGL